jgi:hypothetical protein
MPVAKAVTQHLKKSGTMGEKTMVGFINCNYTPKLFVPRKAISRSTRQKTMQSLRNLENGILMSSTKSLKHFFLAFQYFKIQEKKNEEDIQKDSQC